MIYYLLYLLCFRTGFYNYRNVEFNTQTCFAAKKARLIMSLQANAFMPFLSSELLCSQL